jgi:hypothetical protein
MISGHSKELAEALLHMCGFDPKRVRRARFDFDATSGLSVVLDVIPTIEEGKMIDVTRLAAKATTRIHLVEAPHE